MGSQQHEQKLNCWEFKKCGREQGGVNTADLGVCPASVEEALAGVHGGKNCGRACWVMEGTLCAASVQGSFLDKFKRCLTCDFFHAVEAQEGKDLKNAKELLRIVEGSAHQTGPDIMPTISNAIAVCPGCGQELAFSVGPKWRVNFVGLLEFECGRCGQILRTKGLLGQETDPIVVPIH